MHCQCTEDNGKLHEMLGVVEHQARIHTGTGFHRFTEIGQIFLK